MQKRLTLRRGRHYATVLDRTDERFRSRGDLAEEIRKQLLADFAQIMHVREQLARFAADDDSAARLCCDLLMAATHLFDLRFPTSERLGAGDSENLDEGGRTSCRAFVRHNSVTPNAICTSYVSLRTPPIRKGSR